MSTCPPFRGKDWYPLKSRNSPQPPLCAWRFAPVRQLRQPAARPSLAQVRRGGQGWNPRGWTVLPAFRRRPSPFPHGSVSLWQSANSGV